MKDSSLSGAEIKKFEKDLVVKLKRYMKPYDVSKMDLYLSL